MAGEKMRPTKKYLLLNGQKKEKKIEVEEKNEKEEDCLQEAIKANNIRLREK